MSRIHRTNRLQRTQGGGVNVWRMKKSSSRISLALLTPVLFFGMGIWQLRAVVVNIDMPFMYTVGSGSRVEGSERFVGLYFTPTGQYCPSNHLDPDGNKYGHAHLDHHFPFWDDTIIGLNVFESNSDGAWDAYYTGYTRASGSTFGKNCFAHATGAPNVILYDGYAQFQRC